MLCVFLGLKDGRGDWACPSGYRLPQAHEFDAAAACAPPDWLLSCETSRGVGSPNFGTIEAINSLPCQTPSVLMMCAPKSAGYPSCSNLPQAHVCIRSESEPSHSFGAVAESPLRAAVHATLAEVGASISSVRRSLQSSDWFSGDKPDDRPAVLFGVGVILFLLSLAFGSQLCFCFIHRKSRASSADAARTARRRTVERLQALEVSTACASAGPTPVQAIQPPAAPARPNPAMPPPRPAAAPPNDGFGLLDDVHGMIAAAEAKPTPQHLGPGPPPPPSGMTQFNYY